MAKSERCLKKMSFLKKELPKLDAAQVESS